MGTMAMKISDSVSKLLSENDIFARSDSEQISMVKPLLFVLTKASQESAFLTGDEHKYFLYVAHSYCAAILDSASISEVALNKSKAWCRPIIDYCATFFKESKLSLGTSLELFRSAGELLRWICTDHQIGTKYSKLAGYRKPSTPVDTIFKKFDFDGLDQFELDLGDSVEKTDLGFDDALSWLRSPSKKPEDDSGHLSTLRKENKTHFVQNHHGIEKMLAFVAHLQSKISTSHKLYRTLLDSLSQLWHLGLNLNATTEELDQKEVKNGLKTTSNFLLSQIDALKKKDKVGIVSFNQNIADCMDILDISVKLESKWISQDKNLRCIIAAKYLGIGTTSLSHLPDMKGTPDFRMISLGIRYLTESLTKSQPSWSKEFSVFGHSDIASNFDGIVLDRIFAILKFGLAEVNTDPQTMAATTKTEEDQEEEEKLPEEEPGIFGSMFEAPDEPPSEPVSITVKPILSPDLIPCLKESVVLIGQMLEFKCTRVTKEHIAALIRTIQMVEVADDSYSGLKTTVDSLASKLVLSQDQEQFLVEKLLENVSVFDRTVRFLAHVLIHRISEEKSINDSLVVFSIDSFVEHVCKGDLRGSKDLAILVNFLYHSLAEQKKIEIIRKCTQTLRTGFKDSNSFSIVMVVELMHYMILNYYGMPRETMFRLKNVLDGTESFELFDMDPKPGKKAPLSLLEKILFDPPVYHSFYNDLTSFVIGCNSDNHLASWILLDSLPVPSLWESIPKITSNDLLKNPGHVLSSIMAILQEKEAVKALEIVLELLDTCIHLDSSITVQFQPLMKSLLGMIEVGLTAGMEKTVLDKDDCTWDFDCTLEAEEVVESAVETPSSAAVLERDLKKELERRKRRVSSDLLKLRSAKKPVIKPVFTDVFEMKLYSITDPGKIAEAFSVKQIELVKLFSQMIEQYTKLIECAVVDSLKDESSKTTIPSKMCTELAVSALKAGFSASDVDEILNEFGWSDESRSILPWMRRSVLRDCVRFDGLYTLFHSVFGSSFERQSMLMTEQELVIGLLFAIVALLQTQKVKSSVPETQELIRLISELVIDSRFEFAHHQLKASLKLLCPYHVEAAKLRRFAASMTLIETAVKEYKNLNDAQKSSYRTTTGSLMKSVISLFAHSALSGSPNRGVFVKFVKHLPTFVQRHSSFQRFDLVGLIEISTYIPECLPLVLKLLKSFADDSSDLRPFLEHSLASVPRTVLAEWMVATLRNGEGEALIRLVGSLLMIPPLPPNSSDDDQSYLFSTISTGSPSTLSDSAFAAAKAICNGLSSVLSQVMLDSSLKNSAKNLYFCQLLQMASLQTKTLMTLVADVMGFIKDIVFSGDENDPIFYPVSLAVAFLSEVVSISRSKPAAKDIGLPGSSTVQSESLPDSPSLRRPPTRRGTRPRSAMSEGIARTRSAAEVLLGSLGEIARSGVPIDELVAELADADPGILHTVARLVPRPSGMNEDEEGEEEGALSLSRLLSDSWRERDSASNRRGLYEDDYVSLFQDEEDDSLNGRTHLDNEPALPRKGKIDAVRTKKYCEATDGDKDANSFDNELCTYTVTGSDFQEQHWYYCYSCSLSPNEGVCAVCARVCHRGHDLTYGRFSRFYCDCGAGVAMSKAGVACKALHKREDKGEKIGFTSNATSPSPYFRPPRTSPPLKPFGGDGSMKDKIIELPSGWRNHVLSDFGISSDSTTTDARVRQFFLDIAKSVFELCRKITDAYYGFNTEVKSGTLSTSTTPTLGNASRLLLVRAPELAVCKKFTKPGSFNVKLKTGSSPAKEARGLVQSGSIHRQLLGADNNNRIMVAEAFQGGGGSSRLRVCDISTLMLGSGNYCNFCGSAAHKSKDCPHGSADGSAQDIQQEFEYNVGFDVLGIAVNPLNSRYVAVRGIRDVAVVVVPAKSDSSSVVRVLPLEIQLDAISKDCHIVSLQWLPDSQTRLAVISNRVIKIYDLGKDSIAPVHYVEIIEDSIKDAAFIPQSGGYETAIVLTLSGKLFSQQLFEAQDGGACILTNTVELPSELSKPGNGVSLFYQKDLDSIFVSFEDGKSYGLHLGDDHTTLLSHIDLTQFEDTTRSGTHSRLGPFSLWNSVPFVRPGHVYITAVSRRSGIPVLFDFANDTVHLQRLTRGMLGDLSGQNADGVVVTMSFSGTADGSFKLPHEEGTVPSAVAYPSIVVLSEDGSIAHFELSACRPLSSLNLPSTSSNKELRLRGYLATMQEKKDKRAVLAPLVSLEFFEHLQPLRQNIELGGDILKNLSAEEARKLIFSMGDNYTISPNENSFSIIVRNLNERMCICGLRVMLGSAGNEHVPQDIQIFGRVIRTKKAKRWYDIPFSVDEVLSVDKSVRIVFGKTNSSGCNPAVDAIEVYGLSKIEFEYDRRVSEYNQAVFGAKIKETPKARSEVELCIGRCLRTVHDVHTHPLGFVFADDLKREVKEHVASILNANDADFAQANGKRLLRLVSGTSGDYGKVKDMNRLSYVFKRLKSANIDDVPLSYLIWNASKIALRRPSNFCEFLSLHKEHEQISDIFCLKLRDPIYKDRVSVSDVAGTVDLVLCACLHFLKTEDISVVANRLVSQLLPFMTGYGSVVQLMCARACARFVQGILSQAKQAKKTAKGNTCAVCGAAPAAWHCAECSDYYLCEQCKDSHDSNHTVVNPEEVDMMDEEAMLQAAISISLGSSPKTRTIDEAMSLLPALLLKEIANESLKAGKNGGMAVLGHVLLMHFLYLNVPEVSLMFSQSKEGERQEHLISLEVLDHLWPEDQILKPDKVIYKSELSEAELLRLLLFTYLLRDVKQRERILRKGGKVSDQARPDTPDWISGSLPHKGGEPGLSSSATLAVVRGIALRTALREADILPYLLSCLQSLLKEFKKMPISSQSKSTSKTDTLSLLAQSVVSLPNSLEPFFSASYVSSHNEDLFEDYQKLFADSCLKLADALVIRSSETPKSSSVLPNTDISPHDKMYPIDWFDVLTDIINTPQCAFMSKNAKRVLLSLVDGSRTEYYLVRDKYFYLSRISDLRSAHLGTGPGSFESTLGYEDNVGLVEKMVGLFNVVTERPFNWQLIIRRHGSGKDDSIGWMSLLVQSLFRLSREAVAYALQLLGIAVAQKSGKEGEENEVKKAANLVGKLLAESGLPEDLSSMFGSDLEYLRRLIREFLLDCNVSGIRKDARNFVYGVWKLCSSDPPKKLAILSVLSDCIPIMPSFGKNAAEFADLLACILDAEDVNGEEGKALFASIAERLVVALKSQNSVLLGHINASIYRVLENVIDLDGYYLESTPCLICSDPEIPFSSLPLDSMGAEVKYTETCVVVRLPRSYSVRGILGVIGVSNSAKQVRTVNVYYNNMEVKSISELKNQWQLWKLVKPVTVEKDSIEIAVELPIPITIRNLMIEYASFYDDFQAMSTEKLLCPRCSRLVTDKHAVCSNCHENAYQCRQCRNINYEQPDAFLCNECGYCRFANFSYVLLGRPTLESQKIVNEEDRKKALELIQKNSESADAYYNTVAQMRDPLALLTDSLVGALPSSVDEKDKESDSSPEVARIMEALGATKKENTSGSKVNSRILTAADIYGNYCRNNFESLSSTSRKLIGTRRELLEYLKGNSKVTDDGKADPPETRCFGCANNFIALCMSPLSALARNDYIGEKFVEFGAAKELLDCNLYHGPTKARTDARRVLCLLSHENAIASQQIGDHIEKKLRFVLDNFRNVNIATSVRDEMMLLTELCSLEDSLWNLRFKLVINILFAAIETPSALNSPELSNELVLPLVRIVSKRAVVPEKFAANEKTVSEDDEKLKKALDEHTGAFRLTAMPAMVTSLLFEHDKNVAAYDRWRAVNIPFVEKSEENELVKLKPSLRRLVGWCGTHWMHMAGICRRDEEADRFAAWLPKLILCASSPTLRKEAVMLVIRLSVKMGSTPRAFHFLDLATSLLDSVHGLEEGSQDLFFLLRALTHAVPSGLIYLVSKGLLRQLTNLISREVSSLLALENSVTTDVSRGYALKELCTMLSECVEYPTVLAKFIKENHVMSTLDAYVALRSVVIQKTKLTGDAMDLLLKVLEKTQRTEEEKGDFLAACVSTLNKHIMGNEASFVIEQIGDIICPAKKTAVVEVCLNKAPTQEEFIRGRMNKNPYSSDMVGPLMRDVKNNICTDLDLIGLIEDDEGMELLVADRIIRLNLPVSDVFEHVWKPFVRQQQPGHDFEQRGYPPMNITYRLQGLDGEATEDVVESAGGEEEEIDPEEQYALSSVLTESGGYDALVAILSRIKDFEAERPLAVPLLRLLYYCSKVKVSRRYLLAQNAITTLLMALRQTLPVQSLFDLAEWLLLTIEAIVSEANLSLDRTDSISEDVSKVLFHSRIGQWAELARETSEDLSVQRHMDDMKLLLSELENPSVRSNTRLVTGICRIIPALTFGDRRTMTVLVNHFSQDYKWQVESISAISDDMQYRLQCLNSIIDNIKTDNQGDRLKSLFIEGATKHSIAYLVHHLLDTKGKKEKDLNVGRLGALPALPHALGLLAALAYEHGPTQVLIRDAGLFPVLHEIEQFSGDDDHLQLHALAENVLDACATRNSNTQPVVEELRSATKLEKRNKAQAMREKMLREMGFKVSEGSTITLNQTARARLRSVDDIKEESGVKCLVCHEGYGFRPGEALAAYVFTKRVYLADTGTPVGQIQPQQLLGRQLRSDMGYTTVTHFNTIHFECHSRAARADRRKKQPLEEWDGAALRNSQTLCNNMIPLRGKGVSQATYSHSVGRFWAQQSNIYHLDSPRFRLVAHDLRMLLSRFARQESFSSDSHGGGGDSNILMIPVFIQMGQYHLDEDSSCRRQYERVLAGYLGNPSAVAPPPNAVDNLPYMMVLSLFLQSPKQWKENRLLFLEQALEYGCHIHRLQRIVRKTESEGSASDGFPDVEMSDYDASMRFEAYKPMLVYFGMLNELHSVLKNDSGESEWVAVMNDILRDDFQKLQPIMENFLGTINEELLILESVDEHADVFGLLGEILEARESVDAWEENIWKKGLSKSRS